MDNHPNTFPKEQRLCGKNAINLLYSEGKAFLAFPFRIVFRTVSEENVPVRCLISVPKKRFKYAVDRNYIKRQLRETYRTNKHELFRYILSEKEYQLHIAISYVGEKKAPYLFMDKKMKNALQKLINQLS
jgi:ribonuclease P protein component